MIPTPKSIKQALDSSHAKEWSKAIEAEWHGLWDYGVFEHVKYEDVQKCIKSDSGAKPGFMLCPACIHMQHGPYT